MTSFQTATIDNWVFRLREPKEAYPGPPMFLFHGLTGDETAMEVFASRIPDHYRVFSLRGPYPSPYGGYSWISRLTGAWPNWEDFLAPIQKFQDLLALLKDHYPGEYRQINLMGFSQGSALAYTFALMHPSRVSSLAGLSGFLPGGAEERVADQSLEGIPIFITHGMLDTLVPVARARSAVRVLGEAGARVTYCEAEVGHKLGADCFRALAYFYQHIDQ